MRQLVLTWGIGIIVAAVLQGCADGNVILPPSYVVDEAGETTRNIAGATMTASTFKEMQVHETLRNRDLQYRKAYQSSGFHMEFAMVDVGGIKVYLPRQIDYREMPRFAGVLPTAPSEHPVWKTANSILTTAARWGFGAMMVDTVVGGYESIAGRAGTTYNGPVAMSGSYNQADGDQSVYAGPVAMDNSSRQDYSPGNQVGHGPDADAVSDEAALSWCLEHPPAGYNQNGTPMATATESCGSLFGGGE